MGLQPRRDNWLTLRKETILHLYTEPLHCTPHGADADADIIVFLASGTPFHSPDGLVLDILRCLAAVFRNTSRGPVAAYCVVEVGVFKPGSAIRCRRIKLAFLRPMDRGLCREGCR